MDTLSFDGWSCEDLVFCEVFAAVAVIMAIVETFQGNSVAVIALAIYVSLFIWARWFRCLR